MWYATYAVTNIHHVLGDINRLLFNIFMDDIVLAPTKKLNNISNANHNKTGHFHINNLPEPNQTMAISLEQLRTEMYNPTTTEYLPMLKDFMENGGSLDAQNEKGYTLLMMASIAGNLDAAIALLSLGASINTTTYNRGRTALMYGSLYGHLPIVNLLLLNRADKDVMDTMFGTTAYEMAGNGRRAAIQEVLFG